MISAKPTSKDSNDLPLFLPIMSTVWSCTYDKHRERLRSPFVKKFKNRIPISIWHLCMLNYSLQTLGRNHQNLLNVFGIKTVKVTFEERFSAIIVIVCLVLGFIFNNDYYHWVDGVAMRSHLRLTLANLLSRYYKSM